MTQYLCEFSSPNFLVFGENVPPLIYYSHLPIIALSLFIGLFVLWRSPKNLASQILFFITISFSSWVFLDSIFWASNRSDVIMFVWAIIILIEPLVFIACFYLLQVLVGGKDVSLKQKIIYGLLFLPLIILVPTKYILTGFDLSLCLSNEHYISYYTYVIETIFTLWIVFYAFEQFAKEKTVRKKFEIILITTGIILFLLSFASGNIIGSLTDDWNLAQTGLFGMPIFLAFLAYAIVRLQTFNIRLIGANALVVGVWALVFSLLFVNGLNTIRVVIGVTLLLLIIFGIVLVRSVKKEIEQRERIEKLAADLEIANEQKSEFMSFASHEIRNPITAMRGYASLILDGDFGEINVKVRDAAQKILVSGGEVLTLISQYLSISKIELNQLSYNYVKFDLLPAVKDLVKGFSANAEQKGISINFSDDGRGNYQIDADQGKMKEVLENIIDNSIKYTAKGGVEVALSKSADGKSVLIKVSDTGVGISKETMPLLFKEFSRAKNAGRSNILGSGLGLYLAHRFVTAHGGRVWAESEGEGKGSQFYVELPAQRPKS